MDSRDTWRIELEGFGYPLSGGLWGGERQRKRRAKETTQDFIWTIDDATHWNRKSRVIRECSHSEQITADAGGLSQSDLGRQRDM